MVQSYIQQRYIVTGKPRITFGSTVGVDALESVEVILEENKYWTAKLSFYNPGIYPTTATFGTAVTVDIAEAGGTYKTLFSGTVLYPETSFGDASRVAFQCVGQGYPLNMMNCAEEYGIQSRNPARDAIQGILTNATVGVIPIWVNKYKNTAYDSGYNITTTYVENLTGSIPFISSPYKPVDKFLMDLCDVHTAISQSSSLAGPHWIVDHSNNLRLKRIGATQTGWTTYYGDSEANATLINGEDFTDGNFQPIGKEANVVLYSGLWRRPSSGDAWTENSTSTYWDVDSPGTLTDDSTDKIVGVYSVKGTVSTTGQLVFYTPASRDAAWDFSVFKEFQVPTLDFYFMSKSRPALTFAATLKIIDDDDVYKVCDFGSTIVSDDQWYHIQLPLGNYWKQADTSHKWTYESAGTFNWGSVQVLEFRCSSNSGSSLVDGLHFGGVRILRIARQEFPNEVASAQGTLGQTGATSNITATASSGQKVVAVVSGALFAAGNVVTLSDNSNSENCEIDTIATNNITMKANLTNSYTTAASGKLTRENNPVRFKVFTDNVGKDDSLEADDDSGLMAQLTKAELLRLSKATINAKFTTPLLPDILPGQYIHIDKDYRVTKLVHTIPAEGPNTTSWEVTDDLTNTRPRLRYEDHNKIAAANRPEYQDRQSTSIKGDIDIRLTPLEKAYNV